MKAKSMRSPRLRVILALVLAVSILLAVGVTPACAVEKIAVPEGWVTFLLICNEGMNNDKGNAGSTMMVVSMHPGIGKIRLMMFTWDTFIDYTGYDMPQRLDMPYRNNGPEEAVKVFNSNFGTDISLFMSINYLNLASLIDSFGGVDVDITRAERNALNGMVASKKDQLLTQANLGFLNQSIVEMLAKEYYLDEFGTATHLNGLQAVGFGWLQYDSVYNCCVRDVHVIAGLFKSAAQTVAERIAFYTDATGAPEYAEGRRVINLDHISEDDYHFFRQQMAPIFQMSYNNLDEENITDISTALARIAYMANRQGVNIFDHLEYIVLPLEATAPYDIVAGAKGHLIDKQKNSEAIRDFLYGAHDAAD